MSEPTARKPVIDALARAIASVRPTHPARVAIDGVDAAGKTTLADELVEPIEALGRPVVRVSVDGFHRPACQRYARGDGPEGYYHDTTDYLALIDNVLQPLGPDGDRRFRTAVFDFRTDQPVQTPLRTAPPEAVLLLEGVFLLRPTLQPYWDYSLFVQAGFDVTLRRAMQRDLYLFGTAEKTGHRYRTRYIPGQRLYLSQVRPDHLADVVVHNDDPARPGLTWKPRGPRGG